MAMALFVETSCHCLEAPTDKSQLIQPEEEGPVEQCAQCVFPADLQGEASQRRGGSGARLVNTAAAGRLHCPASLRDASEFLKEEGGKARGCTAFCPWIYPAFECWAQSSEMPAPLCSLGSLLSEATFHNSDTAKGL